MGLSRLVKSAVTLLQLGEVHLGGLRGLVEVEVEAEAAVVVMEEEVEEASNRRALGAPSAML